MPSISDVSSTIFGSLDVREINLVACSAQFDG